MRQAYEIVIVGAGPGGLTAALELAQHGKSVLVIEKNEVVGPKVCAGFLPYDEWTEKAYGRPDRLFSSISVFIGMQHHRLSLDNPYLAVYDRGTLGRRMLASATRAGAEVVTGSLVKQISKEHVLVNGEPVTYRFLIGADGSNSMVRRKLGIPVTRTGTTFQFLVPQTSARFELYLDYRKLGLGCGWVVPHEHHTLVGLGRDMDPKHTWPIGEHCLHWAEERGWQVRDCPTQSWPISYDYRGWQFDNVFLIGDAGGFASGLTGEGIANAVVSGQEAARTILDPHYRPVAVRKMLGRKAQHEKLMELARRTPGIANAMIDWTLAACRSKVVAERLVRFLFQYT